MQTGQLYIGDGFERSDLKPVSADDVARQEDRHVIPRFFTLVTKSGDGFVESEFVEILVPGDSKSAPVRAVDDSIKRRFATAYSAWKSGLDQKADGTPVELLVGTGAMLHQLRAVHIHTVEAVAGLTDGQLDVIGIGARQLRDKAKTFIDSKVRLDAINSESAKDRIISDLMSRLETLEKKNSAAPELDLDDPARGIDEEPPVNVSRPPDGAVRVTATEPRRKAPGKAKTSKD